jgi:hypothetical protein
MVSISTLEIDSSYSNVLFYELPTSRFRDTSARVVRTKTLDGGSVIDHRGVSDGDRAFNIQAELDQAIADALEYIHENNTILNISCPKGFFSGAISSLRIENGNLEMTFLVGD